MTRSQLKRRAALLARQDAALDRWPEGRTPEFQREVAAVAQDLESIASETGAGRGDAFEVARTWRYVGNAYSDLAVGRGCDQLAPAAEAYRRADALLSDDADPIERMKLDYSYGRALLRLCDGKDSALAQQARDRFASALELARSHMPALAPDAERALAEAEQVLAMVQTVSQIDERIGELKQELGSEERAPPSSQWPTEFHGLFEQLQNVYQQDIQSGKVPAVRKHALDPVMEQLGEMLKYRPDDMGGKVSQGAELRELMARMAPLLGDTGNKMPVSPADLAAGRAEAVWRRFAAVKTSLAQDMARQHGGSETQFFAMELYRRCGHADTFVHQHEQDDPWMHEYERDVLRQLAIDARTFALRNHLTIARPIWPSQAVVLDPSAVFFSGSASGQDIVDAACELVGLNRPATSVAKDHATARWDRLRASHVAVFDYRDYRAPRPRQPIDLAATLPSAAVSYELGIALALGMPVIIVADEGQDLPFDVDVTPVRLQSSDGRDRERIAEALDDALYGLQRGGSGSSLPETRAYLTQHFASDPNVVVSQTLRLIDESTDRDPIKFRRFAQSLIGALGASPLQVLFPAWPGGYPDAMKARLFHVTAFGPDWAGDTMKIATLACTSASPSVQYVRGDQVMDPDIVRSIWDSLCQATWVLVDLTGMNANVALELGIAHALGRNVLLVSQDPPLKDAFPLLAKQRVRHYAPEAARGPQSLHAALEAFLAVRS
jgi:hypothetical protein